jgi:hypothetical protein
VVGLLSALRAETATLARATLARVTPAGRKPIVHIVWGGGVILAAYHEHAVDSAEMHKRCITGATITSVELFDRVPSDVLSDLDMEFDSEQQDDTPVTARTLTVEDLDDAEPKK